ncbi:MAG TPA: hypothetical protein VHG08_00630 [Longimicrobium sp.]|nr:hypothetical protein [Longimicrobium sp.]
MSGKRLRKLKRPPRTVASVLTPQALRKAEKRRPGLLSLDQPIRRTRPAPRRRWNARALLRRARRFVLVLVGLAFLWAALVMFGLITPASAVTWALDGTGLLAENREFGDRIMRAGMMIVPVGVILLAWGRGWPARIGSYLAMALVLAFGYTFFLAGVFALGAIVLLHLVLWPFGVNPEPWYPAIYLAFATGWTGYAAYLLFGRSAEAGGYAEAWGGGSSFSLFADVDDRADGDSDDAGGSSGWAGGGAGGDWGAPGDSGGSGDSGGGDSG